MKSQGKNSSKIMFLKRSLMIPIKIDGRDLLFSNSMMYVLEVVVKMFRKTFFWCLMSFVPFMAVWHSSKGNSQCLKTTQKVSFPEKTKAVDLLL